MSEPVSLEEELELIEEREYVVPLGRLYWGPRKKRAKKAIRILREFALRHLRRLNVEEVKIDPKVNEYIWSRNIEKPPRRVKVKIKVFRGDEGNIAKIELA